MSCLPRKTKESARKAELDVVPFEDGHAAEPILEEVRRETHEAAENDRGREPGHGPASQRNVEEVTDEEPPHAEQKADAENEDDVEFEVKEVEEEETLTEEQLQDLVEEFGERLRPHP